MMHYQKKSLRYWLGRTVFYLILLILAFVCILPLYWMVRAAFMKNTQIYVMDPFVIWPENPTWKYFGQAFKYVPFMKYAINTLLYVSGCVFGVVLTSSMAAYAFSRVSWKGKNVCFFIILTSMMLPSSATIIPQFMLWRNLKAIDTYIPLVLPAFLGGGAFNIFLLRQFFLGIPRDLDEAAIIDGAGHARIFMQVIVPLGRSAMIVVALFTFLGCWNDFFGPLLYLNSYNKYTLALGLLQLRGDHATKWNVVMAGSTVVVIPCIIMYILGQRQLIEGITLTGMKA